VVVTALAELILPLLEVPVTAQPVQEQKIICVRVVVVLICAQLRAHLGQTMMAMAIMMIKTLIAPAAIVNVHPVIVVTLRTANLKPPIPVLVLAKNVLAHQILQLTKPQVKIIVMLAPLVVSAVEQNVNQIPVLA